MSTDWLYNDLWRAHVSWLTPRWVDTFGMGRQDFDAVRWLDQLQAAHYQTIIFYAKFHDGQCTFRSCYIRQMRWPQEKRNDGHITFGFSRYCG